MEFKVGTLVMRDTECLRVSCIRPEVSQITLDGVRGEQFIFEVDEFNTLVAAGKLKPLYVNSAPDYIQVPDRQLTSSERNGLDWRIELLGELDKVGASGTWAERLKELEVFCRSRNRRVPSERTFNRWKKLRKSSPTRESLAPRLSLRGRKILELHEDPFEEVVMDEIINCYCGTDKLSFSNITKFVNDKCRSFAAANGIAFRGISRRSVNRRIMRLAHYLIAPGKIDSASFNQDMRVALKDIFTERPYERCEMDAACLPIFCRSMDGVLIGRPWVYAALECASSSTIIILVSIQKPSQEFVLRALEFAFTPKGPEFSKKYALRNPWPAPAAIERVVLDNAVEHHGGAVLSALRYLGTTVDYPQAGKPQHKPFIERFFAELNNSLIYALPGSFRGPGRQDPNHLKKAMAEATLTVAELEREIIKWAADVYMQRPLRRLEDRFGPRTSPAQALAALKRQHVVLPPPDPELFRAACLRYNSELMTLSREGVRCDGEQFQSAELGALYRELGPKQKVEVRYNPLDCTAVSVVHPRDPQRLIEAFNRRKGMPHISFADARATRRRSYQSDADLSGEQYQQDHVEQLRAHQGLKKSSRVLDLNKAARAQERAAEARERAVTVTTPDVVIPVVASTPSAAPRRKKGGAQ